MLPAGWLAFAVFVAVLLAVWITFTLTRLDRLHARVDAAQAALDAQLVRRSAALMHVAESADSQLTDRQRRRYAELAQAAMSASAAERPSAENAVGRALAALAAEPAALREDAAAELGEAATRVMIARRFYNDAVRDTRTLRVRRMPRLLHLAGRRALPQFFDIDDAVPARAPTATAVSAEPGTSPTQDHPEHVENLE